MTGRQVYGPSPVDRVRVGKEATCLLIFPLLLKLVFASPGFLILTKGSVECGWCGGGISCLEGCTWHYLLSSLINPGSSI